MPIFRLEIELENSNSCKDCRCIDITDRGKYCSLVADYVSEANRPEICPLIEIED